MSLQLGGIYQKYKPQFSSYHGLLIMEYSQDKYISGYCIRQKVLAHGWVYPTVPLSDQCAPYGLQGAGGCTCSCPGPQRVPGYPLAIYSDNSLQTGHGQK